MKRKLFFIFAILLSSNIAWSSEENDHITTCGNGTYIFICSKPKEINDNFCVYATSPEDMTAFYFVFFNLQEANNFCLNYGKITRNIQIHHEYIFELEKASKEISDLIAKYDLTDFEPAEFGDGQYLIRKCFIMQLN
jgi:hypothetical protein